MGKQPDLKLRCPIRAHAEKCNEDGEGVGFPACGKDQTFPGTDKLNEHLSRVHSRKYVCPRCKKKFPSVNKNDLESLKQTHASCKENPWPEKKKHWAKWTLMSKEQHDRWMEWTTANNQRRLPEDGQREKKAFWSWRKIYESLYPNTTNFPAPSLASDADQAALKDKDQRLDNRPSGEPQQAPIAETAAPPKPSEGTAVGRSSKPVLDFLDPYSADRGLDQEWQLETGSHISWPETSAGPDSMTHSSTSGVTENLLPSTPSFVGDYLNPRLLFPDGGSHVYTGVRAVDIYEGKPQDFFTQDDQSFLETNGEEDP